MRYPMFRGVIAAGALLALMMPGCTNSSSPELVMPLFGSFQAAQVGVDEVTGHTATDSYAFRFEGTSIVETHAAYEHSTGYQANPDNTFRMADGTEGVVSRTGHVIVSGTTATKPQPCIAAAIRTSRGVDVGVLGGTYLICIAGGDPETGLCWTSLRTAVIDGARFNWSTIADSEGDLGARGTYEIGILDGVVAIRDVEGTLLFRGAVSYDGELIVAADPADEEDDSADEILIALRLGEHATSEVQGSYAGFGFGSQHLGSDLVCQTWTFDMDADGIGQATMAQRRSGGTTDTDAFGYSVSDTGHLLREGNRFGAIGTRGDFFVGVDTDWSDDGWIGLYFGIRTR